MTEIHAIASLLLVRDIDQPFDLSFFKKKLHINHTILAFFWQKSLRHFKLYMIHQLYAKRQQVLSIGYQESLVIRVKNLHK